MSINRYSDYLTSVVHFMKKLFAPNENLVYEVESKNQITKLLLKVFKIILLN